MTRSEIFEHFNSIFRDVFDDDSLVITDSTTAADIDEWDSLTQIMLLVAMEDLFHLQFVVDEISGLKNVGEMADLISRKLGGE